MRTVNVIVDNLRYQKSCIRVFYALIRLHFSVCSYAMCHHCIWQRWNYWRNYLLAYLL